MLWATLALVTAASPGATCEQLWPRVWSALEAHEFRDGKPPFFERVPNAKERLGAAWVSECRRFDEAALSCARGEVLARELAELKKQLLADGLPPAEIEAGLEKQKRAWSMLECREVQRAVDRAAQNVAIDAGL